MTDHKPLLSLLGPKSGIPTLAAARMQRWALLLAAYQYDIEYRSTAKHANADCMSRLPLKGNNHLSPHDKIKQVNQLQFDSLPVSAHQIRTATRNDPLLARILHYTMSHGQPSQQKLRNRIFTNVLKLQLRKVVFCGECASLFQNNFEHAF